MNILNEIMNLANKGYFIEYNIVNQYDNGNKKLIDKGLIPETTYTIYVNKRIINGVIVKDEDLFEESFDDLERGLIKGVKFAKNIIKQ